MEERKEPIDCISGETDEDAPSSLTVQSCNDVLKAERMFSVKFQSRLTHRHPVQKRYHC
jgi:hypothetical protein